MEEEIIELQTKVAFQDRAMEQLSDVVAAQQRQIDELEKRLKVLANKLRDVALSDQVEGPEPPPPHY